MVAPRRNFAAILLLVLSACSGAPAPRSDSAIVVDTRGNDSGAGTVASPFRTLKRALSVATAGATIRLEAGDYSSSSDEGWDYTVPEGVTLRGDSAQSTRLLGPAADGGPALVASDGLRLEQLQLTGFDTALEQTEPGEVTLSQVRLGGDVLVDAPGSTLHVEGSELEGGTASGAVNFSGAQLDIQGSDLRAGASPYGISLRAGALTLTDSSISGGNYGVYQLSGSSSLRRTELSDYASIGFYFASGALDLGSDTEAGDNAFVNRTGASGAFGIYVDTGSQPATASNTSFNGVTPPASVVQAGDSEIAEPGEYFLTPGERLTFFRVAEP